VLLRGDWHLRGRAWGLEIVGMVDAPRRVRVSGLPLIVKSSIAESRYSAHRERGVVVFALFSTSTGRMRPGLPERKELPVGG